MSYLTVIQPEAELDLDEAFEYFKIQNSELAFDFIEAITLLAHRCTIRLEKQPAR